MMVALLGLFIRLDFLIKKARRSGLFASSVSWACTLSRLSSSQCETLVVCVYSFSLIRSVDSPAVHLLTVHRIDPSSSPLNTLVTMCSVEMAGVEPASPAPFGLLHTTILHEAVGHVWPSRSPRTLTLPTLPVDLRRATGCILPPANFCYLLRNLPRQIRHGPWPVEFLQSLPGFFGCRGADPDTLFLCARTGFSNDSFPNFHRHI